MNRDALKRSFADETKAFISDNIHALEVFLKPALDAFGSELADLDGPRGRVLERSFEEARTAWEKFFWAALGRHWVIEDEALETAVQHAEQDLLALSQVLETVVVLEGLEVTEKVKALSRFETTATEVPDDETSRAPTRRPSETRPLLHAVSSSIIEDEQLLTLDPTEEMDEPQVMARARLGPVPPRSDPEDTTVVEGLRNRPKI